MRKRISCKVIKSVPFDSGDVRSLRSRRANLQRPKITNAGAYTYTPRLLVRTASIDDNATAVFLDCRA